MHRLSSAFVLGYHGCSEDVGTRLLNNESFEQSKNEYDWLGDGIYFWEANPDRGLAWAREVVKRRTKRGGVAGTPFVVGAVIDLGFCLDLVSTNGSLAVKRSYETLKQLYKSSGDDMPVNHGGNDLLFRNLDRAVIEYLHVVRQEQNEPSFDTVRALFPEAEPLYPGAGFLEKTHIQVCVRNPAMIKGVFRVPNSHFTE